MREEADRHRSVGVPQEVGALDLLGLVAVGLAHRLTNELTTGPPCIGMRKPVPQVEPDVTVVRVQDERVDIVGTPRSNDAIGKDEVHKLEVRTKK